MYCRRRCCSASRCAVILNGSRVGFRFANARFKMDRVVVRRPDVCADIRRPDVQFLTIPAGAGQFDPHVTLGVEPRTALPTSPLSATFQAPFLNMFKKCLTRSIQRAYSVKVERVQFLGRPIMTIEIATYLLYLAISVALTVWVARTLHKNGRIFLVDVFHGNEPLADSVNHLLVVGFYLIKLGYVSLALKLDYIVAPAYAGS